MSAFNCMVGVEDSSASPSESEEEPADESLDESDSPSEMSSAMVAFGSVEVEVSAFRAKLNIFHVGCCHGLEYNIIQDLQGARPMVIANLDVEPFEGESLAEWHQLRSFEVAIAKIFRPVSRFLNLSSPCDTGRFQDLQKGYPSVTKGASPSAKHPSKVPFTKA